MILRQRSTFLDPFLLKFVCHHFDSRPLRWVLKLFGLWSQEVRANDRATKPERIAVSFPIHLNRYVSTVPVNKAVDVRSSTRENRR